MDHFSYLCFVFVMFPCLFIVALYSPAGWERADLLALLYVTFIMFCHFLMWFPGSNVVLNCIHS